MNNLKMILVNGKEVEISEVNFPLHVIVVRDTRDDVLSIWDSFTSANLARVEFMQGDSPLFSFVNCSVRGNQIVMNEDGTVTGHYYLNGELEKTDYETAAKILLGEEE